MRRRTLARSETCTVTRHKADGTLGKEIKVRVDGGPEVKIHTSCSRTIGPDLVRGDFTVVKATSRDGGQICPLGPPPECAVCAGGVTQLTLRYTGPAGSGPGGTVEVVVKAGKTEIFREDVVFGEEFTLHGHTADGKLGKEIKTSVHG